MTKFMSITRENSNCFPTDTKPATFRCWNFSFVLVPETSEQSSKWFRPVNTKANLVQPDNRYNRRTASAQMARNGLHPSKLSATNPPPAGKPPPTISHQLL